MDFAPIAAGDRAAFEALFRLHYRPLCGFAMGYLKDGDKAEDLVQDLFFRLWLDREKVNVTTSVKAYLYAAVRNRCLNAVKAGAKVRALNEDVDDPIQEDERSEDEHAEQIAERLDISVKTVENQMGKALKTLREDLADLVPLLPWLFWIGGGGDGGI
jgi:DNA-directed RNA polymerase specialized sigma24 family protein